MLYSLLKLVHVLSIVVWVGGMVFAHYFLRPAAAALQPAERLTLMHATLQRFFQAVSVAAVLALVTGFWMLGRTAKQIVQAGGDFAMPWHWTAMAITGTLMVLIYGHIRFVLFKRFAAAVKSVDWAAAGAALGTLRQWVLVNLFLGVATIGVAVVGG